MSRRVRETISRCAMGVLAAALLYGGFKCLKVAWMFYTEPERHAHSLDGQPVFFLFIVGVVLMGLGVFFLAAAVLPTRQFIDAAQDLTPTARLGDNEDSLDDGP